MVHRSSWLLLLLVIYALFRSDIAFRHARIIQKYQTRLGLQRIFPAFSRQPVSSSVAPVVKPPDPKTFFTHIVSSPFIIKLFNILPSGLRALLSAIHAGDLLCVLFVHFSLRPLLKFSHKMQVILYEMLAMGKPYEYKRSIIGFTEDRAGLLVKLMTCNYIVKLICSLLNQLGFRIPRDLPLLLSSISYSLYIAHFVDLFKTQFMKTFVPQVAESRRQSYVLDKSSSVIIWVIAILVACEMVSTFLKVPLSSTLAFGGVGGLAIGLSARDIASNFLGGMLLLFNEPFTPGDMVSFRLNGAEFNGRVERVGWGQTRIRGKDTRPTYIPNSHFVQTAVTNQERITHRKFETTVKIRLQDYGVIANVIEKIKENLRSIPKLDVLSMPYRVSFVTIGDYYLEIEVVCYFATKSIDEFLTLQQLANLEVIGAVQQCGAALALPTTLFQLPSVYDAGSFGGVGSSAGEGSAGGRRRVQDTAVTDAIGRVS